MKITPSLVVFGIAVGLFSGLVFSFEVVHIFAVRNEPVVTGRVVGRQPIRQLSVPRVDFTIRIGESGVEVHARAQHYLLEQIPDTVRFRYNGDFTREVFLFEHEENPYLIVSICWGSSLFLALAMRSPRIRRALGWPEIGPYESAT